MLVTGWTQLIKLGARLTLQPLLFRYGVQKRQEAYGNQRTNGYATEGQLHERYQYKQYGVGTYKRRYQLFAQVGAVEFWSVVISGV